MTRGVGVLTAMVVAGVLAGCPSKSTPTVEAGTDAAPPKPPKPKEHVETRIDDKGIATDAAFHLHSRFPEGDIEAFSLEDGIAVVQWANPREWKLSTTGTKKPPRALTGRIKRDEDRGDFTVRGTTELAFALQRLDGTLHRATPFTPAQKLPNRYTHVVELRSGQWIGYEVIAPDESVNFDYAHGEYRVVGGKGLDPNPDAGHDPSIPLVPSHLRIRHTAVHLADGKICANATVGSAREGGIWTADVAGHQYLAPFTALDVLYRGADGECYVLDKNLAAAEVFRVKGDDLQLVAEPDFNKLGYDGNLPLQVDRDGGLWFVGAGWIPRRIVVTDGVVTTTKYPLPDKLTEKTDGVDCVHPTAMRVIPVTASDVWVLTACRDENHHFSDMRPRLLLHTGARESLYEWPAP